MSNVAKLAAVLHSLFSGIATELGRASGFIRRERKLTAADFLNALVLGFLKRRDAPLEDLALPLGISRQALDRRLDSEAAADFCRRALIHAVGQAVHGKLRKLPLLGRFKGVFLDDSTQAKLPDDAADDFPGCGSGDGVRGKAGIKALVRFEIQEGRIHHVGIHAGKVSDHDALAQAPPLPAGCLHLADLGFADFDRLEKEAARGISWITRLPAHTQVRLSAEDGFRPLSEVLRRWRGEGVKEVDVRAEVGLKEELPGRLVAFACPAKVAAVRLAALEKDAKRRGREVSGRQREMCWWTVFLTNVPDGKLTAAEVWRLYRLRWQIELLFKRFKSEGGLDETNSGKRYRVECECYLKLLGQVVRNWLQMLRGGPLRDVNGRQVGRVLADGMKALSKALRDIRLLEAVLIEIEKELANIRKRTRRKKGKTCSQSLVDKDLTI